MSVLLALEKIMKKKQIYLILGLACMFLCACNSKNIETFITPTEEKRPIVEINGSLPTVSITPLLTPTNTPCPTPTPAIETLAMAYLNSLSRVSWTGLDSSLNSDSSIRNSNLLNYGLLTYDTEGNIYYSKEYERGIYRCTSKGEDRYLISEEQGDCLQVKSGWLYYRNKKDKCIYRISMATGMSEQIFDSACVEFIIGNESIMIDALDKVYCMDLDGNNKEMLAAPSEINLFTFTSSTDFWLSNAGAGTTDIYNKGYLFKFDGKNVEVLKERGNFPLLAGNYLSVVNPTTLERHIWNLDNNKDVALGVRTEKAVVSDGTIFYYAGPGEMNNEQYGTRIYYWDGTKSEELLIVDGAVSIYHMFLTPEKLYYLPHVKEGLRTISQLWYYDLETGETGQVY